MFNKKSFNLQEAFKLATQNHVNKKFKEAKKLSAFKNEALAGTKKLELCYSLVGTLESQVKSLHRALDSKDTQTTLLRRQVRSLREAYKSQETNWSIGLIILSAAVAGYVTYETVTP